MSTQLLAVFILVPTAAVVVAVFLVMWGNGKSKAQERTAFAAGTVVAGWAVLATVLAARGTFIQGDVQRVPPVGIALVLSLVGMTALLAGSPSVRSLLTNQKHLILLNVWRLVGVVFLLLMASGQMPALWALPSGIGDILVGAAAPLIARAVDSPGGRRRAVAFNLFGLADLVVAVGLGVTTSPGPAQVFRTTPTSALATHFPFALVPTFLVPLAVMVHVVSMWQLLGLPWTSRGAADPGGIQTVPSTRGVA
jgi:hypothetical protein